ncbi:DnaK family protein [Ostertagia ostertagi]
MIYFRRSESSALISVVGFDIGNLNCYIGIARQGGIEVITNDYSLHATPACVAFTPKNRSMGVAARQSVNTNFKNTIINFKHMIGRKFSDAITQKFIPFVPCQTVQLANDDIGFKVSYQGREAIFTPEQVLAALLTKLKDIVESQLKDVKKVTDCVVTVPSYFTDVQRRATQAAIQSANLNALRVMNESTAIALAYGIYKQDLPEESARARYVVFLDVGHASTQASLVAFNKGKLQFRFLNYANVPTEVGAAMQCAILSPAFRVREFSVKDSQPYRVKITWSGGASESGSFMSNKCDVKKRELLHNYSESDVFVERDEFPFSKMVSLYRADAFQVDARYALPNTVPHTTTTVVLRTRLNELRKYGDPIVERYREAEARKAYEDYVAGGEAHAHIDSADMEKVINAIEEKKRWLDEARHKQERRAKTEPPIVFAYEIAQKQQVRINPNGIFTICSATMYDTQIVEAFEAVVLPILNKKKPAPPPKKKEQKPAEPPENGNPAGDNPGTVPPQPGEMEVD